MKLLEKVQLCTGSIFQGEKPFPEQLSLMVLLFNNVNCYIYSSSCAFHVK